MRQLTPRIAVFSLNSVTDSTLLAKAGLVSKQVVSCYKGKKEWGYVVNVDNELNLNKIVELAMTHNQESILLLDEWRKAKLLYLKTGKEEDVGMFVNVPKDVAEANSNYIQDKDQYFITVGMH